MEVSEAIYRFRRFAGVSHEDACKKYTKENKSISGKTRIAGPCLRSDIYRRDGMVCQYCLTNTAKKYHIDHVVPFPNGPTLAHNLVVSCVMCNMKKGHKVSIPNNLDVITKGHPEWRVKIVTEASWECLYKRKSS